MIWIFPASFGHLKWIMEEKDDSTKTSSPPHNFENRYQKWNDSVLISDLAFFCSNYLNDDDFKHINYFISSKAGRPISSKLFYGSLLNLPTGSRLKTLITVALQMYWLCYYQLISIYYFSTYYGFFFLRVAKCWNRHLD